MKRIILTFSFAFAGLFAADAQMRLTLDEAVDIALSENPTVKVADMEVERYDYVRRQTWGTLLPQLSASGSYSRSIVKSEMRGGISFGADNTFAVQGDLTLPLFAPAVYRTLKLNDTQRAAAVEAARASRIDLVAEVKKAFYNILLAEQSLVVLRESEATVRRTVDDTKLQYDNGLASEYDLLTAEVQLSNLQPTILQTENSIRLAKLMLKMYLSIPEGGRHRGRGRARCAPRGGARRHRRPVDRRFGELRAADPRTAAGAAAAPAPHGQCGASSLAGGLRHGHLHG